MKEQIWIKTALTPFSGVYGFITWLRNIGYRYTVFSSEKAPQFVISVGNLTVGGTGKTPLVEYLAKMLSSQIPTAILSRGYGRKTKGFRLASASSNASEIGDEPMQYFTKFYPEIVVAVCEDRLVGAARIAEQFPETKLLLLDDAFQHQRIIRDVNLLLCDYNRPFYEDLPFPAGRLREGRSGAKRADAIIVTKCPPALSEDEKAFIRSKIQVYGKPDNPVFFAFTDYAAPLNYTGGKVALKKVKMVAGIANPEPFRAYLDSHFNVIDQVVFPDHYHYGSNDVEEIIKYLKNDTFVVTTEKDMVKLKPLAERSGQASRFAYIPVTVNFGNDTALFNQWITQKTAGLIETAE
ncbi:tetraacyldisaccharide 4'-kinase [Dyadobacter sediminis]|uniref:Tetraacyldisaccharide 4'-kinase n=1 Tax=Dyadobacter sediminis TaxID=1493691 RepID=A0A5R9KIS6_9BACT|nr:tetraacyldisaccharide 4'-kinase [Dyadobacter sediminis]TLU96019.1 tetraacyldisaccharide 4'-kinase [Dyadobacter sediminis]GGB78589.1 tetraacyldisaccharide 4'-kinase [Dyadobacter sediminis]